MVSIVKTKDLSEESFGAVKVKNLFADKNIKQISAAIIRVEGINRKHANLKSEEFHYVLEGSGSYTVDEDEHSVESGDLVHIAKNHPYFNSGQMTLLVFCSPSYDADEIEYPED